MDKRKYLTYCGLYCNLCGARNTTPKKTKDLAETLKKVNSKNGGRLKSLITSGNY